MSAIEDNVAGLQHMEHAVIAMRQGLAAIHAINESTVETLTTLWGEGNNLAGKPVGQLLMAGEKVEESSGYLHAAQVCMADACNLMRMTMGEGGQ